MLKYKLRCKKLNFNCRQTKKIVDVGHNSAHKDFKWIRRLGEKS